MRNGFYAGVGAMTSGASLWDVPPISGRKFPKVDTHVHLYDFEWFQYPGIPQRSMLHRTFMLHEYETAAIKSNVQKMVFVESGVPAEASIEEADWAIAWAKDFPKLKAVIAQADMSNSIQFPRFLEVLKDRNMIKGVRIPIQAVLHTPLPFIKNMNLLARSEFSLDLLLKPNQLSETAHLLRRCAALPCILNHMGQPDIQNMDFEEWSVGIEHLAEIPHVYCKISDFLPQSYSEKSLSQIQFFFDFLVEKFGFDRLMFGSDWPNLLETTTYFDCSKAFEELIAPYSDDDIYKCCEGNAEKVYRI